MCESRQADFLRQYGQLAERLYKAALLVTGEADTAVHAVERAAAHCYRNFSSGDLADAMYRALWHECKGVECAQDDDYCRALCGAGSLRVGQCPGLIIAFSRLGAPERMALALLLSSGKDAQYAAKVTSLPDERVRECVQTLCAQLAARQ